MPRIKLLRDIKKHRIRNDIRQKTKKEINTTQRNSNSLYNKNVWRKMKKIHLMEEPLCQRCISEFGIVTKGQEVHHKIPFMQFTNSEEQEYWFYNSPLVTLCKECHDEVHRNPKENVDYITYKNIKNI